MMQPSDIATAPVTADERAALDRIEAGGDALIARLKAWVAINSGSRNTAGLEAMRAALIEGFEPVGGVAEAVDLPPSETVTRDGTVVETAHPPAFRLRVRPDAPTQILLTGHHDTVYPADHPFQSWTLRDDDVLNGPGAADMKGGLVVMAAALAAFETTPGKDAVGFTVLISPDEEIGSHASGPVLHAEAARAHMGMTYEPALADGSLAGARKGSGNFSLVVRGRAAHAGREHAAGRNAVEAAAAFTVAVQARNGLRDGVTFNVGAIEGGAPVNTVPPLAICRFNVRAPDPDAAAWAQHEITACVADIAARDGIGAELHGGFTRPPKPMTPQNAQVFAWVRAAGAALGQDIRWRDTGGVCEGNNLWAAGCANVDTLGVRGADIHSADEIMFVSSLVERAQLSTLLLMRVAAGAFDARALRAEAAAG